jgi:hypothetical protein
MRKVLVRVMVQIAGGAICGALALIFAPIFDNRVRYDWFLTYMLIAIGFGVLAAGQHFGGD